MAGWLSAFRNAPNENGRRKREASGFFTSLKVSLNQNDVSKMDEKEKNAAVNATAW